MLTVCFSFPVVPLHRVPFRFQGPQAGARCPRVMFLPIVNGPRALGAVEKADSGEGLDERSNFT